jgi:hypothetical protein
MTRKVLIGRASYRAWQAIVLGAGLEPASLSAYAPQTYVSASSTTRASRGGIFRRRRRLASVHVFFSLMLMLVVAIESCDNRRVGRMNYQRLAFKF